MTTYIIITFSASAFALIYLGAVAFRSLCDLRSADEYRELELENEKICRENAELRFALYKMEQKENEKDEFKNSGNGP